MDEIKVKVVKRVNLKKKYTAKNGKEYTSVNYYLELPNGNWVPIQPTFKNGYNSLDTIAVVVKNG